MFSVARPLVQPPSGGCVLKRGWILLTLPPLHAAAFGRLCVETRHQKDRVWIPSAAAFGRLCVETLILIFRITSGRRSRLRAAVC